jgi:hypothetical protein
MLPRFPFTFRKEYGVSRSRDTIFTVTRGTPGKVAVTWTGNGDSSVTLQYTDKEVEAYLRGGADPTYNPDMYPFARWTLIDQAPEVEQPKPVLFFDGKTFVPQRDGIRLTAQYDRVFDVMKDKEWRSLSDIAKITNDPEASISARLRDFRKEKFGAYTVERRHVANGLYEYRLAA